MKNFFSLLLLLDHSNVASSWQPLGSTISSEQPDFASFGSVVDLSEDGRRVVVGAPASSNDDGAVLLYELNESATLWNLLATLPGASGEGLGDYLSLSPDGLMVAVRRHHITPNVVQVYQVSHNSTTFLPVGSDVSSCEANGDAVTLGQATYRPRYGGEYWLLVSCETYDNDRGMVQAYELYDGKKTEWKPYLDPLQGTNTGDHFGSVTAFVEAPAPWFASGRVFRVAVSSPNFGNDRGLVQVFNADEDAGWSQLGNDLVGTQAGETFGASMDMSATEQPYLVVGSPNKRLDGELNPRGVVHLFHWRSLAFGAPSSWQVVGTPLEGITDRDLLGHAVAISWDGGRVAVTSMTHDKMRGYVRVYDRDTYDSLKIVDGPFFGKEQFDEWGASVALNRQGSVVVSGSGVVGDVQALIDDSPFCQVPVLADDNGEESSTAVDIFLDRATCRSNGVTLVSEPEVCSQTFVFMNGESVPCLWKSRSLLATANPTPWPSAAPPMEEPSVAPITEESTDPTRDKSFPPSHSPEPTSKPTDDTLTAVPTATTHPSSGPTSTAMAPSDFLSGRPSDFSSKQPSTTPLASETLLPSSVSMESTTGPSYDLRNITSAPSMAPVGTDPTSVPAASTTSPTTTAKPAIDHSDSEKGAPSSMLTNAPSDPVQSGPREDGAPIRACRCDEHSSCTSRALPKGADLRICIAAISSGVKFDAIDEFSLEQEDLTISLVEDGTILAKNVVKDCSDDSCRFRTPVSSALFGEGRPAHLVASGTVVVANIRNLRTLRTSSRQLQRILQFNTIVSLELSVAKESTVEDEKPGGMPAFLLWLLLALLLLVVTILVCMCVRRRILKRG
jgi:hypothetical protein